MRHSSHRDELVARVESAVAAFAANPAANQDGDLLALSGRLNAGTQKLAEISAYTTRDVSGQTTIKFFQSQDAKDKGLTSIANAMLDKNQVLMVGSIIILAGTSSSAINGNRDTLAAINYGSIGVIPGLASGELTIRYHGKNVTDKMPLQRFVTDGNKRVQQGELVLDNPIMLRESDPFEATIDTGIALPAKTAVRLILVGTGVVSA